MSISRIKSRIAASLTEACGYSPLTKVISEEEVNRILAEEEKTQTNADRIRSMTDDELLDFICSIETYDEGSTKTIEGGVAMCSVTEVEQWLKTEVGE